MNTAFMIMSQYGPKPIIPAEDVARDFFGLSKSKFFRNGEPERDLPAGHPDEQQPKKPKGRAYP